MTASGASYQRPPVAQRTTRDYACSECGAQPGERCRPPKPSFYHRDRERRFIQSVNRQAAK
jgi:hypothetical protein